MPVDVVCVCVCVLCAGERIVYGDSKGHIIMLLCGTRVWPARDLICQDEYQDYIYIHQDHSDWVSQVRDDTSHIHTHTNTGGAWCARQMRDASHVREQGVHRPICGSEAGV